MATIIERTATDDVTDALSALRDIERYTCDLRTHLEAASRQNPPEPGTLDAARHVVRIVGACVDGTRDLIVSARRAC